MATTTTSFSSSSSTDFAHNHDQLNLESIHVLVTLINQHIEKQLADTSARKSLRLKCISKLKIQKQEFFEFSEHSILSNLYWGIESVETAIQTNWLEEKTSMLKNSEKMLQVPALLDEHGATTGIPNHYLVCCSYLYLSIVSNLRRDERQSAIHFLQSLLVAPRLVYNEFAPELCRCLLILCMAHDKQEHGAGRSSSPLNLEDNQVSEAMKWIAKRYKACLTYYHVMSFGETSQWFSECRNVASPEKGSQYLVNRKTSSKESSDLHECEDTLWWTYYNSGKVHPTSMTSKEITEFQNHIIALPNMEPNSDIYMKKGSNIKCLKEMLQDSQSDTPITSDSCNTSTVGDIFSEEDAEVSQRDIYMKKQDPSSMSNSECTSTSLQVAGHLMPKDASEVDITKFFSRKLSSSYSDFEYIIWELEKQYNCQRENETTKGKSQQQDHQHTDCLGSATLQNHQSSRLDQQGSSTRRKKDPSFRKKSSEICLRPEENSHIEQLKIIESIISKVCFSEGYGKSEEDYTVEITRINDMSNNKMGIKHSVLKDLILDQLLMSISISKEETVVRASMSILSTMASVNKSVIEDIKKGLELCDLARALKKNVHEAVILMYLMNPSPAEIQTLELLPTLVEVICTAKKYECKMTSLILTPPTASMMIIENLVKVYDHATNGMHLAAITSPRVLAKLMDVPRHDHPEDYVSLACILVSCMRIDEQCRKYISNNTPLAPFISLLGSKQKRATFTALEFFDEILRIPRFSATSLLKKMQKEGSTKYMDVLLLNVQKLQPEHKLLAANLLLHLDILDDLSGNITYQEEALEALLTSVTSEENSASQQLSAFLLSNLGGTYAWTGEPYTVAWLVKKTGLTSQHHRNMIRHFNWSYDSQQDASIDIWSSKIAKRIIRFGSCVFHGLVNGLKSKRKRVAQDCLTTIAWLGCEIMKSPDDTRHSACEIMLSTIEKYVHPGLELEERVLACLCIYNYTSGRGMQKLINFSEGVRESLRRLSNITWMAEELLKVAAYFQPDKWRISCVHTQILEVGNNRSGAVSALIYYKGQVYSGHADGSIKVWSIKGQTATLLLDMKKHEKAVTCFSLYEPGNCLLSGSVDKTIRFWQVIKRNPECIEVVTTKEPLRSINTCGELIFTINKSHRLKVFDSSRKARDLFKNKLVKCLRVTQGKVYAGCIDSSIQELSIINNRHQEIKAPSKGWVVQNRPINSVAMYKDWLYSASTVVEGSNIKDWRSSRKPNMSMVPQKGSKVLAMEVVEDFIYLNCSSSRSTLQIWLRGTQHKVGRLSSGSKITSLLTANDMVLCGTETGIIKGWIPL